MFLLRLIIVMACSIQVVPAVDIGIGAKLKNEIATPKVRIVLGLDAAARYKYLENLKTELAILQQQWGQSHDYISQKIVDIKKQIEDLKSISIRKTSNLTIRKNNTLHKLETILIEIQDTRAKILELLQQHIEFGSQQIAENVQENNLIEEKSLYTFFDFQNITKKMFGFEDQVRQLLLKKDELFTEISRQESILATKEKDFGSIEQIIEEKKHQPDMNKDDISLLDLEKEVIAKERELASLRLSLYQKQQELLSSKEIVLQEHLHTLSEQADVIRNRLYIDSAEVQQYERKNIEQKKQSELKRAELIKLRQDMASKKLESQDELDRLRHRFKLSVTNMQQFIDLDRDVHTVSDRFALYSVTYALNMVLVYDRTLQKIKTELLMQDAQERQTLVSAQAVQLLYDIVQGHSKDSETFEKERTEYKNLKQMLMLDVNHHKEMIVSLHGLLKDAQKSIEYLTRQQEQLGSNSHLTSTAQSKKWADSLMMLAHIIKDMEQQYEIMLQMNELYEHLLRADEEAIESVSTILHEFDMIGVWHRSMSAVTWDGIKNIIPNIGIFLKDVYIIITTYVAQLTMQKVAYAFAGFGFGGMLAFFLMLFGIFIFYLFLQALLPTLYRSLTREDYDDTDPLYRWRHLFAILIGFGGDVFKPLFIWFLCFVYESLYDVPVALLIMFYIYSIVFWIYASRRLLLITLTINRRFDYFLLSKRLIDKFSLVYSFFSIATIIILILRKMFIVVMAHQVTELPNILLRVYHVVIFISIVFSLDKDEIIQLLPKKSAIAQRIVDMFERYYYLFLLGLFSLLIMCDPYLGGYGSLLWHIFWNLFLTISICATMFLLYTIAKQYSTVLFFQEPDSVGVASERFDYAKTWYAIYVITSMLLCLIVTVVLCSHVWSYGFTYGTVRKIALHELFKIESVNSAGKIIPESFKVINLLYIIFVSLLGVVFAYLFKKVVLQKLFDIQYVDPGIQNTVIIISRYVIIIFAIMLACVQSKLGSLVTYTSYVGLVVFGWSFKDLFTDFVAYFFILVQRPVKLGDYVKIDSDTMGVVRKVGPRAVILRRQNTVNIVVPNSTILKASLYNWNYTRSYIGLEEILFSVPFGTDIQLVKKMCLEVIDEDPDVLKVPQPFVRLQDFGDKGYVFMIRGFLSSGNTLRQWEIASNIRFALVDKLTKAGIAIAGPSMKIFIKNNSIEL